MLGILRDLLRYNAEFRIGIVLVGFVLLLSVLVAEGFEQLQNMGILPVLLRLP